MRKTLISLALLAISPCSFASPVASQSSTSDTVMHKDTRSLLAKMVFQALNYSPEIKVADADKNAADYDIDQAKGARWPQLQLGTTAPMASMGGNDQSGNKRLKDTSLTLNVTTTLYDWGKNSENISSATHQANAATHQVEYEKQQIAFNTFSQLIELSRYQQNQIITQAYVRRMHELVNMLVEITQTDAGRHSELVQARAKLLAAETSLQRINDQRRQSEITLQRLTGQPVRLPDNIDWTMQPISSALVMSRISKHPSLLKAEAEATSAQHQIAATRASGLPQLNWVISKNTAKDSSGNSGEWYTGLSVQWTAFSGGSQQAAVQASAARAESRKSLFSQARMDMEYQVHNLTQSRDAAAIQSREYLKLSKETDQVSKIYYEQWLRLGKRTLLDVLTAENDRYNNQIATVNAQHDVYSNNVRLVATASLIFDWFGLRPS